MTSSEHVELIESLLQQPGMARTVRELSEKSGLSRRQCYVAIRALLGEQRAAARLSTRAEVPRRSYEYYKPALEQV